MPKNVETFNGVKLKINKKHMIKKTACLCIIIIITEYIYVTITINKYQYYIKIIICFLN